MERLTILLWLLLLSICSAFMDLELEDVLCKILTNPSGKHLMCSNVSALYFESFDLSINQSYWFSCTNCSLDTITEETFSLPKRNNISHIYLVNSQIRRIQKFTFSKFPFLKYLILHSNKIDFVDNKSFVGIKRLLSLDLSQNCLNILTNNIFSELENLDLLNLNYNNIFYIQTAAFVGLINLKYLYLSNNCLEKLENNTFQFLPNLKILYLEHNDILAIDLWTFGGLRNLNYLYLNNNSINSLLQYNFKPLINLVDLQLRNNNLEEIETGSFNGLKNLLFLYLGNNKIATVKSYGFIGLDSLKVLDLTNNNLTEINLANIVLPKMTVLWLNKNRLESISIEYQIAENELAVLDLSDNRLATFNFNLLINKLPNIQEVFVGGNPWMCRFLVNLYNFYEKHNVQICISDSCSSNSTQSYIDSVCYELINNVTDTSEVLNGKACRCQVPLVLWSMLFGFSLFIVM